MNLKIQTFFKLEGIDMTFVPEICYCELSRLF